MIVTVKHPASKRTKERIKEHGPDFEMSKHGKIMFFEGDLGFAVLLRSKKTNWLGWLPAAELNLPTAE